MTSLTTTQPIKCLVWDLDNTLWRGVLLEDERVELHPDARTVLMSLDERGILHTIASKNDPDAALTQLEEFGLVDYFLYPQIGWGSKVESIKTIAELFNIGLDAIAFIDDQPLERDEITFSLPDVRCYDAADLPGLLALPELSPASVTVEARTRRQYYQSSQQRQQAEAEFAGPSEAFLQTLDLELTIFPASAEDLTRAFELTERTHQLNSTGRTYSLGQLDALRESSSHLLLLARLTDKYGPMGIIGLTLIECEPTLWRLKLLLMSCRVMSLGVGTALLTHVMQRAQQAGGRLQAEFRPTDRNRPMNITLHFSGFTEIDRQGDTIILEHPLTGIPMLPDYMQVQVEGSGS